MLVAPAAVALVCFCAGVAGEAGDWDKQLGARPKSDAHRTRVSTRIRLFIFLIIVVIIISMWPHFLIGNGPAFSHAGSGAATRKYKINRGGDHIDCLTLVICRIGLH